MKLLWTVLQTENRLLGHEKWCHAFCATRHLRDLAVEQPGFPLLQWFLHGVCHFCNLKIWSSYAIQWSYAQSYFMSRLCCASGGSYWFTNKTGTLLLAWLETSVTRLLSDFSPLALGFQNGVCHFCILKIDQVMQYNGAILSSLSWAGFACTLSRGPTDLPLKMEHCYLHDWKLVWPDAWVT